MLLVTRKKKKNDNIFAVTYNTLKRKIFQCTFFFFFFQRYATFWNCDCKYFSIVTRTELKVSIFLFAFKTSFSYLSAFMVRRGNTCNFEVKENFWKTLDMFLLGAEISPQNIIKAPKGNYEQN